MKTKLIEKELVEDCPLCKGTAFIRETIECPHCYGTGMQSGNRMIHVDHFIASLSDEVRAKAKEMYEKATENLDMDGPPLFCGPEARAQAKGPEALAVYYKDGEKYEKKINMDNWD